jgi:hypothetical protein
MTDSVWLKKGGTLSDKSARKEFGLSQDEIIEAIKSGKLQYRKNYMHGNPFSIKKLQKAFPEMDEFTLKAFEVEWRTARQRMMNLKFDS